MVAIQIAVICVQVRHVWGHEAVASLTRDHDHRLYREVRPAGLAPSIAETRALVSNSALTQMDTRERKAALGPC